MRESTGFQSLNAPLVLTGKKVRLRPRRIEDAVDEFRWRTDEELCHMDAMEPPTITFAEFSHNYASELENPGLAYSFAIDTLDGKHIGECSLFHIDHASSNAEIGIIIGERSYWNLGYGTDAITTFVSHIFQSSDLSMILLRTLEWNLRAQECFKKCGFESCGSLIKGESLFLIMALSREKKGSLAQ